ncbi:ribosome small subunit-dependent GTPase A, partial [Leptospira sp. Pond_2020]|nr:ribosome small subunit-dependent GTPase A [Leptospira sp. Pond_2020]
MFELDSSVKEFFTISRVYGAYYEIYSSKRGIVRA